MSNKRGSMPGWGDIENSVTSNSPKYWLDELLKNSSPSNDLEESPSFEIDGPNNPTTMFTTGSSNPARPRTLRAGYDYQTQKLVVVFRDGTWYEYRGVSPDMWHGFQQAESKGKYLRESGLDTWMDKGPANVGAMTRAQRVQMSNTTEFAKSMYSETKTDLGPGGYNRPTGSIFE